MNIEGLNRVNALAGYEAKKIVANPAKTVVPFVSILNSTIEENAKTISNFSKEESSLKSSHSLEDDVVEASELEDKYCSLCGSRIKEMVAAQYASYQHLSLETDNLMVKMFHR